MSASSLEFHHPLQCGRQLALATQWRCNPVQVVAKRCTRGLQATTLIESS